MKVRQFTRHLLMCANHPLPPLVVSQYRFWGQRLRGFLVFSIEAIYRVNRCFSEGGECSSYQVVVYPANDTMEPSLVAVTYFIVLLNFFLKVEGVGVGEVVSLQNAISSNGGKCYKNHRIWISARRSRDVNRLS